MDSIRYIKIKDTSRIIGTLPTDHIYYCNPQILTGFDLNAVVILHNVLIDNKKEEILSITEGYDYYTLTYSDNTTLTMYNILGYEVPLINKNIIFSFYYPIGIYILIAIKEEKIERKKIIINR